LTDYTPGVARSLVSITQTAGLSIEPAEFEATLDAQRQRFCSTFGAFDIEQWMRPTRCSAWDAHTVFRHLTDAAEVHLSGFTGVRPPFVVDRAFDPNVTPALWLAYSDGETPEATLERYDRAARAIREYAVAELPKASTRTVYGPYGKAHWSTITTHILWDAWLHERDILMHSASPPPPADLSGTADERKLVGLYAVLMGTIPSVLKGAALQGTVALDGQTKVWARFGSSTGQVEVHETAPTDSTDVTGDLLAVVDSLAGRGRPVAEVTSGSSAIIDSYTALATLLQDN
jgi:hypothetical protein